VHVCDVDTPRCALAKSDPGLTRSVCDVADLSLLRAFDIVSSELGGLDAGEQRHRVGPTRPAKTSR
jgi:hypothetical protein